MNKTLAIDTKKSFTLLLTFILFIACDKQNKSDRLTHIKKFQNEAQLIGEATFHDEYDIVNLSVIDSYIFAETSNSEHIYKIFDAKTLNFLGYIGERGDTPYSWLAPRLSDQYIKKNDNLFLWINDAHKYNFMLVDIKASLKEKKPILIKQFKIHPKEALTQNLVYINDSSLIGNLGIDAIKRGRLKRYNPQTGESEITDISLNIENINILQNYDLYQLFFSYLRFNKKHKKIVSALRHFNRVDFFDQNDTIIKSIVEGDQFNEIDALEFKKNNRVIEGLNNYYIDIHCDDKYIYTLFNGTQEPESPREIRIFNWDGKAIYKFNVSDSLTSLTIDSQNGIC